jgi:hypothetical protein
MQQKQPLLEISSDISQSAEALPEEQTLVFQAHALASDDSLLRDYNVQDGSIINWNLRRAQREIEELRAAGFGAVWVPRKAL